MGRLFTGTLIVSILSCLTSCFGSDVWQGKEAEVYILLDTSSSIAGWQFTNQISMVADLVSGMDIGPDRTRVGVAKYSTEFQPIISLENSYSKAELVSKIREIKHTGGNSYTSRGIQGMRKILNSEVIRPDIPRIGVIFTDGKSRKPSLTFTNATAAKEDGVFLFAIGVGSRVWNTEIVAIASDPKRDYLFQPKSFNDLHRFLPKLSMNMAKVRLYLHDEGTCGEKTKVDTVFVYDETILGQTLTKSVKQFLKTIVQDLRMNSGNMRVGVVSKSCADGDQINLGDYLTREDFSKALDTRDRPPKIASLIDEVADSYFYTEVGHRSDATRRIVYIMTHSLADDPYTRTAVFYSLFKAKFSGIEIYIIRHGSDYDKSFLHTLTTPTNLIIEDIDKASEPFLKVFCRDI